MKKIKITVGTYGYRKDEKSPVVLKDKNSAPFEVKDIEAERVVGLGIAEYVETPEEDDKQSDSAKYEDCSLRDLQKIAKEMGLKANGSREDLIERITKASEEDAEDDETDNDEEPPVLSPVDPEV